MNATQTHWDHVWTSHDVATHHDTVVDQICRLGVKDLLEIGAGSGRDVERLHALGLNATYTDFSETALQRFRKRCPHIAAFRADATRLPFADSSLELVYSLGLLEHFDPEVRAKLLKENFRVASRYVLVDVPQLFAPAFLIKKAMMATGRWPYGWETQFSLGQLVREVQSACSEAEMIGSYGRELFPLPRNVKNKVYGSLPEGLRQGYLATHSWFARGVAGSLGVVFAVPDPTVW